MARKFNYRCGCKYDWGADSHKYHWNEHPTMEMIMMADDGDYTSKQHQCPECGMYRWRIARKK